MSQKGETLSETDLGRLKPVRGEGGRSRRAFCPFHGSDQQRSLRVDSTSGRFQCFACGVWGYMDWAREDFSANAKAAKLNVPSIAARRPATPRPVAPIPVAPISAALIPAAPIPAPPPGLDALLASYQAALPGSPGADYLEDRRIPLSLAVQLGVGYAAPGLWAHRSDSGQPLRDWKWGRLVFPHTAPSGLVNLYGRAVGSAAPKTLRHDHLPGAKGYFNFAPLLLAPPPLRVYVCEGPFDALSLMAATGDHNVIAIFGVNGWHPAWAASLRELVFAMDSDPAGQRGWRAIARQLAIAGKRVRYLEPAVFGGAKDLNEAWVENSLDLENLQKSL